MVRLTCRPAVCSGPWRIFAPRHFFRGITIRINSGLAEALAAQGRAGKEEAYVYLLDLWERRPKMDRGSQFGAEFWRKRAIRTRPYATITMPSTRLWDGNPDVQRRAVRLELTEFLLREKATTQAQAELIALSGDLPQDPVLHVHVGDLFMQAQDYQHALQEYRKALTMDRQNSTAMAGTGKAAFELGNYSEAQRHLQQAVAAGADSGSAQLLETVNLVLRLDPFQRKLRAVQRAQIAAGAFATAGRRLQDCLSGSQSQRAAAAPVATAPNTEQALQSEWSALKPKMTEAGLRRDPDAVEAAMDLVFAIERQTSVECGAPTGPDLALLLISKLHEGN